MVSNPRFMDFANDRLPLPSTEGAPGAAEDEIGRKFDLCSKVLAEACRLVQLGRLDAPVNQLVLRARELLDDIDEVLLILGPHRNLDLVVAATLHGELEKIQLAISSRRDPASETKD